MMHKSAQTAVSRVVLQQRGALLSRQFVPQQLAATHGAALVGSLGASSTGAQTRRNFSRLNNRLSQQQNNNNGDDDSKKKKKDEQQEQKDDKSQQDDSAAPSSSGFRDLREELIEADRLDPFAEEAEEEGEEDELDEQEGVEGEDIEEEGEDDAAENETPSNEQGAAVSSTSLAPIGHVAVSGTAKALGGIGGGSESSGGVASFFQTPTPPHVEVVPMFKKPVFPGTIVPVLIHDSTFFSQMLKNGVENKLVGLFLVKEEERNKEVPPAQPGATSTTTPVIRSANQIENVGVLARVTRIYPSRNGATVVFAAIRRISVTGQLEDAPRLTVSVEDYKEQPYQKDSQLIRAHVLEIISTLKELSSLNPFHKDQLNLFIDQLDFSDPADLADVAALLTTPDASKMQEVLATKNIEERIMKSLSLLKQELETVKLQNKISKGLEERVNQTQRKYYLNEQLKLIKKELGLESDEKETLVRKYQERLEGKVVPEAADKVIKEELAKLQTLEPQSSEYSVCRNYLDWLTVLPWGAYKEETFNLPEAQNVLDEDHYGLKKLKERILEFIAVGKLKGTVSGKIICFAGPPGVGKTSIGKSIARALNREFYRFSVGGMSDVAEIKGHRRTYVGAMPGKLMQVMKLAKSANPVIMIDEIDKLGRGHGDPASALLEGLDPEQNNNFLDHYLDVPFDLSKVLFICTANSLDTIPRPLLDRMEVLRLSGYILEEKLNIAKRYLVPKIAEDSGIKPGQYVISDHTLRKVIRDYCREAGVRNLQQQIEKIFRKVAFKIATGDAPVAKPAKKGAEAQYCVHVTEDNIEEFLGKARFTSDRYYVTTPVGVVMGLAWTEMGGSTLYIETQVDQKFVTRPKKGKAKLNTTVAGDKKDEDEDEEEDPRRGGSLIRTGKMGEVMQESSSIAYTYAKKYLYDHDPENAFFERQSIHMHIPEGATPKDGPSAGITMVTALLSLAMNKPVKHNIAMTGEITLTGKVLEIGGVKEKVIAARRSGVTEVLLPKENRKDWTELEPEITEGFTVHFVDYYDDVFNIAFNYDQEQNKKAIEVDAKKHEAQIREMERPAPKKKQIM